MSLRQRAVQTCPENILEKYSRHFWRVGHILTKHFFPLIRTGWVCIHGNFQEPLRFTTMSWNYLYCLISFCLFLSLPLSQGSLEKEKDLRKMEWTERGQFNICFCLIGNRGRMLEKWCRNPRQTKRYPESNNIWTFPYSMNIQHAWLWFHPEHQIVKEKMPSARTIAIRHVWGKTAQNRETNPEASQDHSYQTIALSTIHY